MVQTPFTTPPNLPPWTGGPNPAHLEQIAAARARKTKIRRAELTALFSGWTTAIFAGLTILFSITSPIGLLLGMGMAVVSLLEFRGAGQLRRLDRSAPRRLAMNQIAFGLMLFAYGAVSLWMDLSQPLELASDPQVRQMLADYDELIRWIVIAVYGTVMAIAIIGPGLTALYYYTRTRHIDAYISQTPQWILDLQRAGMSV